MFGAVLDQFMGPPKEIAMHFPIVSQQIKKKVSVSRSFHPRNFSASPLVWPFILFPILETGNVVYFYFLYIRPVRDVHVHEMIHLICH